MDPECLERKFVVFDSDLDLKGHEAEVHPHAVHGQRNRLRDARKIDISFNYQSASDNAQGRRGGRNNNNNRSNANGQGSRQSREDQGPSQPQLTPHQIQQIAMQQQLAQEHERRIQSEATEETTEAMSDLSVQGSDTGSKSMMRTRPPAGFGSSLSEPAPVRPVSSATSAAARVAANIPRTSSPRVPVRMSSPVVVSQSRAEWPAVSAAASVSTLSPTPRQASGAAAPETLR